MNPIKQLLDRYTRMASPDSAIRKALAESIKEEMGMDIPERVITVVNGSAYVDIDTTLKSALFMHQEAIVNKTNERLGKRALVGMR